MEMTFAVLVYLLQRRTAPGDIYIAESADKTRRIQRLRLIEKDAGLAVPADTARAENTLYLTDLSPDEGAAMFFPDTSGEPERTPCCRIKNLGNALQITELLMEEWQDLTAWENRLSGQILRHAPFAEIMAYGKTYLQHEYTLIDRDMNVMFSTPGYRTELAKDNLSLPKDTKRLSSELTHSLLMRKDFHEAALKTEGFYFYDHFTEAGLYCRNIFLFGQYYARLICRLKDGEDAVPRGEAQIFETFAGYIELFFENHLQGPDRHQNDLLHQLCRTLYTGETPDEALLQTALASYRWKLTHQYQALILRPYQQDQWQSQMEITLPFLIRELERQWPDSCAVSLGDKIFWLVNRSLSEQSSFFSEFSVFIRENVCRAGISEMFSDISFIHNAVQEAEAALRLGSRSGGTFWYYQFENYRLDYCLDIMTKELPAERLLHPAVRLLRDRDQEKGTELVDTLRAYLNCGMNMTHAAEQLYIHRTTFCRRMEQIYRLTGISEINSDLMLEMLLSLKLLEKAEKQETS